MPAVKGWDLSNFCKWLSILWAVISPLWLLDISFHSHFDSYFWRNGTQCFHKGHCQFNVWPVLWNCRSVITHVLYTLWKGMWPVFMHESEVFWKSIRPVYYNMASILWFLSYTVHVQAKKFCQLNVSCSFSTIPVTSQLAYSQTWVEHPSGIMLYLWLKNCSPDLSNTWWRNVGWHWSILSCLILKP